MQKTIPTSRFEQRKQALHRDPKFDTLQNTFLPLDLWHLVLQHLPLKCIFRLKRVNKIFSTMVADEALWKQVLLYRLQGEAQFANFLPNNSYLHFFICNAVKIPAKLHMCTFIDMYHFPTQRPSKVSIYGAPLQGKTCLWQALKQSLLLKPFDLQAFDSKPVMSGEISPSIMMEATESETKEYQIVTLGHVDHVLSMNIGSQGSLLTLLVFDVSKQNSWQQCKETYLECKQSESSDLFMIVATKTDLPYQTTCMQEIYPFLWQEQLPVVCVNLKSGHGVERLRQVITACAFGSITTQEELALVGAFTLPELDLY